MRKFFLKLLVLFSFPSILFGQGSLTSVTVSPADNVVGRASIHTVQFTTQNAIPSNGRIVFIYPSGFNVTTVSIASSPMGSLSVVSTAGNSVVVSRTGGSDTTPGNTETVSLANVTNTTDDGTYTITVRTEDSGATVIDEGTSSNFTIQPGPLDHFGITGVGATETAGNTFQITITAQDVYDNTVTSFSSTVNIRDLTDTISPNVTSSFSGGVLSNQSVTVTKTHSSNVITVTSSSKTGTSSPFRVDPAALDHFDFNTITSPRTAGTGFNFTVTAKDQYGNTQTGFSGTVTISDGIGTISPTTSGSFIIGILNQTVSITQARNDVTITVDDGFSNTGTSNYFNVIHGSLHHFALGNIAAQATGVPFVVSVTAQDVNNNTVTSFNGPANTVNITHIGTGGSSSISPDVSGNFSNGIWSGNVTITQSYTNDQINVTRSGGTEAGNSNTFNVVSSSVDHFVISNITSPQTAGSGFSVTITAQDATNNTVTSFSQTANLVDATGTNTPQQVTFSAGVWTGTVTITKSFINNTLTITGGGKSGTSNQFNVNPASVSAFEISTVSSPQTAGNNFNITLTAKDQYGNTATGFGGTVTISDATLTISPTTSGSFSNGTRTQTVMITRARSDVTITVNDGFGHTGSSNLFNVTHGVLNRFAIQNIAAQATGVPFVVTVTAQDVNNNTVTSFNGPGNTVNITHSGIGGAGSIDPDGSGNFINGIWNGNVTITQTQTNDQITVRRTSGTETGVSSPFNVTPSSVDHFVISNITSPRTAGMGFTVTITAQDANNNTATGFNQTANLFDETGTNTPLQVSFTNGLWTGSVTITESSLNNTLTITGMGKSGTSNQFNVNPATVNRFDIGLITSPKRAGESFIITITAKDAFGNTATGFNGTVSIMDGTGTINPSTSGNFSNGVRTQMVSITRAQTDVTVNVNDGSGHTGISNLFNIIPGSMTHFFINNIGVQIAGTPFTITITAEDTYHNIAESFTGTVNISDLTGTVKPSISGNFVKGQWSSGVTVYQAFIGNQITVTRTGGTESGSSNVFDVHAPPGIKIIRFTTSQAYVTSEQEQDWTLFLAVQNLASSYANLDSIRLRFMIAGDKQNDYVLNIPDHFIGSGTSILNGVGTDSLLITVDRTGMTAGNVTVQANVYCLDSGTGFTVPDVAYTGITVQTEAQLQVQHIHVSQKEVTRGQLDNWTVAVVVKNSGGSEVAVDSSADSTAITFSMGTLWQINRPTTLSDGGWILSGGEIDSLIYVIEKTGDGEVGLCDIRAVIRGTEINTSRSVVGNTQSGGWATVLIENPASIRIIQVKNLAMNAPYVNTGQDFAIRVTIDNTGEDGVHDVQIFLNSDGLSNFPPSMGAQSLAGGESLSVELSGRADDVPNVQEIFTAQVEAYSDNTNSLLVNDSSIEDTTRAIIQFPSVLLCESVVTSVSSVVGGQGDPWTVKVALRNTGQAAVILDAPQADDLSFWVGNILQSDYKVNAPASLASGYLTLNRGKRDTLIYTVVTTGRLGGTVQIRAHITGKDKNIGTQLSVTNSSIVTVQAECDFRIISTYIETRNKTIAGDGYVNTDQNFQVVAIVENGLGETIQDIWLKMTSNGTSLSGPINESISRLKPTKWDSVIFNINADEVENILGERFTVSITDATLSRSGLDAPVGPALDSTAMVIIQKPAHLSLSLELSNSEGLFSTGQTFTLKAHLNYTDAEMGKVDSTGRVWISLPTNYILVSQNDTALIAPDVLAEWSIKAPNMELPARPIYVKFSKLPIEKNTGSSAAIEKQMVSIDVTTLKSTIATTLSISSPAGAMDRVLSTGQSFIVRTVFQCKNVKNITAQIHLPYGYQILDNIEKSVTSSDVLWQLNAPDYALDQQTIEVTAKGVDALQENVEVKASSAYLNITTVSKTDVRMNLSILSPVDAIDGSVSLGQLFVVNADVENLGEADTLGITRVTLDPLPKGYSTTDPLTKNVVNGKALWTIKAPSQPTSEAVNIKAQLTTLPDDENTNNEAYVSQRSDGVAVTTVGAWLAVSVAVSSINGKGWNVAVPGQEAELMSLKLQNRGLEGTNRILIDSLMFVVEDRQGTAISPNTVFSKIMVVNSVDTSQVYSTLNQVDASNPVKIPLNQQILTIGAESSLSISILGEMVEGSGVAYFRIHIPDSSYICAKDYVSKLKIPVKNIMDEAIEDLCSELHMVFQSSSEIVLWNCPNPFGDPGNEKTSFVYNLEKDTDVYFKIYTLVGELVWTSPYYTKVDPQGKEGSHAGDVMWDGLNDRGLPVLNGIYLLLMATGDGDILKTKIAVVR